jgi:hypothetical protein
MSRNIFVVGAAVLYLGAYYSGVLPKTGGTFSQTPIPEQAEGKSATDPRPVKKNVIAYHTGDAGMNAAKDKARATLPRFYELIGKGTPGTYTVKYPLT